MPVPHAATHPDAGPQLRAALLESLFPGDGEMAARCRAMDWAHTPFGAVEGWSQSLRTIVRVVLTSRNPMFLWWGPELAQIYNDAYRPSFGAEGRHPVALGMKGRECWVEIWPTIGPQIEQVMTSGEATWHEDQLVPILRNGRLEDVWWTYGYSPVFDDDGSIGGTLVVCQETTTRVLDQIERERLLAETARAEAALKVERARLAEVFRVAPTFLAVVRGPKHVFELVNDAYVKMVGGRPLVGREIMDALPEIEGQGFVELLDGVLRTGEPYVGRETLIKLVRPDGDGVEDRFVDFVYLPLTEADGTRSGVIAHGSDVTEQVRVRQEIEQALVETERAREEAEIARAEAEAANRAKSDFLAIMSHELRTPLNAIGGYAELIEMGIRGPVTPAQREDLRRLQASQVHLLGLINEVLNYAKLETGTVHFDTHVVSMRESLTAAESLVAPQARGKGLSLTVAECPPHAAAVADPEKLRQVLVNLLSNAVKFTDRGGEIELSCALEEHRVLVRVRDTGVGIPSDKLDSIFDPFVQVRSDLTRPHEGTGLGLAISRDLARGMGGDLMVESSPGLGSTFILMLPRGHLGG